MRLFVSIVAILLMVTAAAPRLQAQTAHSAPQSALDAAVQQHVDTTAADREAVLRVLGHSEVKGVATRAGIDQIGRASCRERERGWVGGGGFASNGVRRTT